MKQIGVPQGKHDVFLEDGGRVILKSECGKPLAELMITQPAPEPVSHWQARSVDGEYISSIYTVTGGVYMGPCDDFAIHSVDEYQASDGRTILRITVQHTGQKYDG